MELAVGRLATCGALTAVAMRWRRRACGGTPARCCGGAPHHGLELDREAFIVGREFLDVHSLYNFTQTIGQGGFGRVVRATHLRTGIQRAIKVIPKRDNVDMVKNEIQTLSKLDHPHVIKLIEYFEDERHFYLVQSLINGPDLADWLSKAAAVEPLPERDVSVIIRDCLRGVVGCHALGIIHRDIKLDNFMVAGRDGHVKMIDFGLARRCHPDDELTEVSGTHLYRAPEMMVKRWRRAHRPDQQAGYDQAVDVWSLGVVLFVLLTGEQLFLHADARVVRDRLADPRYVQDRLHYCRGLRGRGGDARDLLERMLRHDPDKRITTAEALQHPFVVAHMGETLTHTRLAQVDASVDAALPQKLATFASMPRLRQIALLAVTHRASEQLDTSGELRRLRQIFRSLDRDGDGQVSLEDLQTLKNHGLQLPGNLREIFLACDINGAGYLNFVEFVAAAFPRKLLTEQLTTEAFMILNRNCTGEIDANDLRLLARQSDDGQIEAIIHEAEELVRGPSGSCVGRVSFEDFHRLVRGPEVRPPQRPQALPALATKDGPTEEE